MGLPAYIINHDELKQIIIESLINTGIGVDIVVNAQDSLDLEISIESLINNLKNLDEAVTSKEIAFSNVYMEIMNFSLNLSELLNLEEKFVSDLSNTLTLFISRRLNIKNLTQKISDVLNVNGLANTITLSGSVGNTSTPLYLNYIAKEKMSITSITSYQTLFNYNDFWNVRINNDLIFKTIYTKSVIETKNFVTNLTINKGDKIEISFHNNSKKTKTINYDIDFLIML